MPLPPAKLIGLEHDDPRYQALVDAYNAIVQSGILAYAEAPENEPLRLLEPFLPDSVLIIVTRAGVTQP